MIKNGEVSLVVNTVEEKRSAVSAFALYPDQRGAAAR